MMDEQERRETTEAEKQYSEAGKKHTDAMEAAKHAGSSGVKRQSSAIAIAALS